MTHDLASPSLCRGNAVKAIGHAAAAFVLRNLHDARRTALKVGMMRDCNRLATLLLPQHLSN